MITIIIIISYDIYIDICYNNNKCIKIIIPFDWSRNWRYADDNQNNILKLIMMMIKIKMIIMIM